MSTRRSLSDLLIDVASVSFDALRAAPGVQVREITVTLPVEIALRRSGEEVQLLGDVPRLVTRTAFDLRPSRLEVVWEMREPA